MANRLTTEEKADREIFKNMRGVRGFTVQKKSLMAASYITMLCSTGRAQHAASMAFVHGHRQRS
jgi:hypothetical protein